MEMFIFTLRFRTMFCFEFGFVPNKAPRWLSLPGQNLLHSCGAEVVQRLRAPMGQLTYSGAVASPWGFAFRRHLTVPTRDSTWRGGGVLRNSGQDEV